MGRFVALVGLLLAGVLLASAALKLRRNLGRDTALRSALAGLIPARWLLLTIWRGVAGIEAALALLLFLGPPHLAGTAAAGFFLLGGVYAAAARVAAPGRPCGCFGASNEAVSWWTTGRALFLGAAAAAYSRSPGADSARVLSDGGSWLGLMVVLTGFLALSPAFFASVRRRHESRRARVCAATPIDLERVLEGLKGTKAWAAVEHHLRAGDPASVWREGCWLFVSFAASVDEKLATAVFTVRLPPGRSTCRAVLRQGLAGDPILVCPDERLRWTVSDQIRAVANTWRPSAAPGGSRDTATDSAVIPRDPRYPAPTRGA